MKLNTNYDPSSEGSSIEDERSSTLGAELEHERNRGDGDWHRFGDDIVFAAGEFGWVFDRAEFEAALEARLVVPRGASIDTIQLLEERCKDISSTERGRRALQLFEETFGLRLQAD